VYLLEYRSLSNIKFYLLVPKLLQLIMLSLKKLYCWHLFIEWVCLTFRHIHIVFFYLHSKKLSWFKFVNMVVLPLLLWVNTGFLQHRYDVTGVRVIFLLLIKYQFIIAESNFDIYAKVRLKSLIVKMTYLHLVCLILSE